MLNTGAKRGAGGAVGRQLDEHPNAHRSFWQVVGVALAGYYIFWGIGWIQHDNRDAVDASLAVLKAAHMRTWGAIALVLGCWLIYEVVNTDRIKTHWAARCYLGFCVVQVVTRVGSWLIGPINFAAPWAWVAFGVIAAALLCYPPPVKWTGSGRE